MIQQFVKDDFRFWSVQNRQWRTMQAEKARELVQALQEYINKKELEQLQVKD